MLTKKQKDLLVFIQQRLDRDGVPPSFDEMKDALDLRSKSGIHRLITALEERGFIRRLAHRARAIEVLRPVEETPSTPRISAANELPVMGRIAAGVPIEAISDVTRHVQVPPSMLRGDAEHFALEVVGDSMIDAGIFEGDIVVLRRSDTAHDGEIVVALVDDQEATLKTLRRNRGTIVLEAANPAYPDQIYPAERVAVQGCLSGLLRSY